MDQLEALYSWRHQQTENQVALLWAWPPWVQKSAALGRPLANLNLLPWGGQPPLSPSVKAKGQAEESWGPALVTRFRGALAKAYEEVESRG